MPAETVDTYPMNPPQRSTFSPDNTDEDIKEESVPVKQDKNK